VCSGRKGAKGSKEKSVVVEEKEEKIVVVEEKEEAKVKKVEKVEEEEEEVEDVVVVEKQPKKEKKASSSGGTWNSGFLSKRNALGFEDRRYRETAAVQAVYEGDPTRPSGDAPIVPPTTAPPKPSEIVQKIVALEQQQDTLSAAPTSYSRLAADFFTRNLHYAVSYYDEHVGEMTGFFASLDEPARRKLAASSATLVIRFAASPSGGAAPPARLPRLAAFFHDLAPAFAADPAHVLAGVSTVMAVLRRAVDDGRLAENPPLDELYAHKVSPALPRLLTDAAHNELGLSARRWLSTLSPPLSANAEATFRFTLPLLFVYFLRYADIYDSALRGSSLADWSSRRGGTAPREDWEEPTKTEAEATAARLAVRVAAEKERRKEEAERGEGEGEREGEGETEVVSGDDPLSVLSNNDEARRDFLSSFAEPEFWEKRYRLLDPQEPFFDWYCTWSDLIPHLTTALSLSPSPSPSSPPLWPSADLLYVGCGNSRLAADARESGWVGKIHAVDRDASVISHARGFLGIAGHPPPSLSLSVADATSLPFSPHSFDLIIEKATLDAVQAGAAPRVAAAAVLAEVGRVLRPGGIFLSVSLGSRGLRLPIYSSTPSLSVLSSLPLSLGKKSLFVWILQAVPVA
jgi:hypothetical protein